MDYQQFLKDNKWTTILSYNLNNPQAGGENPEKPQLPNTTQQASFPNNANKQGNVKIPNATLESTNKQNASNNSLKLFDKLNPQQQTLLKYEALLCQCSYLSRMSYVPADIFCRMTQHLDLTPNAFNNYIRAIEKIYDKLFNYSCSYNSSWVMNNKKYSKYFNNAITDVSGANDKKGYFVKNQNKMNAYIYLHSNSGSHFNKKPTLYVAFKGSSSLSNFKEDLKSQFATDTPLNGLQNLENCKGKAGNGFVKSLLPSVEDLITKVNTLKGNCDRIIITGHSLGGALATLFGMCLAMPKNFGKPIHVVSFGAPTLFDPIGRNEFNALLNISKDNIFTLDRITDTGDVIPPVPVDLNHGGYNLLKTELKAFSKTGRTNDIGELRSLFGIQNTIMQSGGGLMNTVKKKAQEGVAKAKVKAQEGVAKAKVKAQEGVAKAKVKAQEGVAKKEDKAQEGVSTEKSSKIGMTTLKQAKSKAQNYGIKNDLLIIPAFVELFSNYNDFVNNGVFNQDLYRSKYRIKLGTNAKEQKGILMKAMPDANPEDIKKLFWQIEQIKNNSGQTKQNQAGGLSMGNFKSKAKGMQSQIQEKAKGLQQKAINKKGQIVQQRKDFGDAATTYKERTKSVMPNKVNYSCYKIMSMGVCHVVYMGVTYATVLRIPSLGMKVRRKEPTSDYTLYYYNNKLISLNDAKDATCKYANNNTVKNGNTGKNATGNSTNISNSGNASVLENTTKSGNTGTSNTKQPSAEASAGFFACSIL